MMAWKNTPVSVALFSLALSVKFVLISGGSSLGQVPSQIPSFGQPVAGVTFEPPSNDSLEESAGGASRDGGFCPQDRISSDPAIVPLMPNTNQGLTVSDRPTVFVYLPKTSAKQAYFIVKDKTEDYYHQTLLPIPNGGGILSIPLPEEFPGLEIGKNYQWSLVLACEMPVRADSPRVEGWFQRVEPTATLRNQLGQGPSREAAALYGAEGMWYDTVTTLAQLRRSQPQEFTRIWEEFLNSSGLEAIANQPLIDQ